MRILSTVNRLIPVGFSLVCATLVAAVVLRAAASDAGRAPRHATMAAMHRDAGRASAAARGAMVPAGRPIGDSLEKNSRRLGALRRVEESAATTYLGTMLAQVDSAIRRWPDDRTRRPLRVALRPGADVDGYRAEFASAVSWSVTRWNGALLPVQLDFRGADTARADIVVSWASTLDSGRTGKADVTWDQRQHIRRAAVTLATHTPDGRRLTQPEMTALALHELGHALGLAHSDEAKDALYPMTRAGDLTPRDRATARLLYDLPPGSLRN